MLTGSYEPRYTSVRTVGWRESASAKQVTEFTGILQFSNSAETHGQ